MRVSQTQEVPLLANQMGSLNNDKTDLKRYSEHDQVCKNVTAQKVLYVASYMIAFTFSLVGNLSFAPAAKSANSTLGIPLAIAYVVSFTGITFWAMSGMLNEVWSSLAFAKNNEERNNCICSIKTCVKTGLFLASSCLGFFAQFSQAYVAYYYSGHLAYLFLVIFTEGWIPAYSLYLAIKGLEDFLEKDDNESGPEVKKIIDNIIDYIKSNSVNNGIRISETLSLTEDSVKIMEGLRQVNNQITREKQEKTSSVSSIYRFANYLFYLIGLTVSIARLALLGVIGYRGMYLLSKSKWIAAISAAEIIAVNLYLSGFSIPKSSVRFFKEVKNVIICESNKNLSHELMPIFDKVSLFVCALLAAFSWGPSYSACHIFFKGIILNIMEVIVPCGVGMLVILALRDISDQIVIKLSRQFGSEEEKKVLQLLEELELYKSKTLIDSSVPFEPMHSEAEIIDEV